MLRLGECSSGQTRKKTRRRSCCRRQVGLERFSCLDTAREDCQLTTRPVCSAATIDSGFACETLCVWVRVSAAFGRRFGNERIDRKPLDYVIAQSNQGTVSAIGGGFCFRASTFHIPPQPHLRRLPANRDSNSRHALFLHSAVPGRWDVHLTVYLCWFSCRKMTLKYNSSPYDLLRWKLLQQN